MRKIEGAGLNNELKFLYTICAFVRGKLILFLPLKQ